MVCPPSPRKTVFLVALAFSLAAPLPLLAQAPKAPAPAHAPDDRRRGSHADAEDHHLHQGRRGLGHRL